MIKLGKQLIRGKSMFKLNQEKFIEHIQSKWTNRSCVMCGGNEWSCSDYPVTPLGINENKGISIGGKIIPLVAVTCNNCGNTVFVNALIAASIKDTPNEKGD